MPSYFSQVASRATEKVSAALQPAGDYSIAHQSADSAKQGPTEDAVYPSSSRDQALHDLIVPKPAQSISHMESLADSFLKEPAGKGQAVSSVSDAGYFTKHVERSTALYQQQAVQVPSTTHSAERPATTELRTADNLIQQTKAVPVADHHAQLQPAEEEQLSATQFLQSVAKETHSQKKKMLEPSAEKVYHQQNKIQYLSTVLHPSQDLAESQISGSKKANKQVPKLVIGKITVEVLPPVKPTLPKAVTRVIQNTPASDNSKPNKLSFGLGQL